MDHLDHGRPEGGILRRPAEEPAAEQEEGRPDALAGHLEEVGVDLRDQGIGIAADLAENALNAVEVGLDGPVEIAEDAVAVAKRELAGI